MFNAVLNDFKLTKTMNYNSLRHNINNRSSNDRMSHLSSINYYHHQDEEEEDGGGGGGEEEDVGNNNCQILMRTYNRLFILSSSYHQHAQHKNHMMTPIRMVNENVIHRNHTKSNVWFYHHIFWLHLLLFLINLTSQSLIVNGFQANHNNNISLSSNIMNRTNESMSAAATSTNYDLKQWSQSSIVSHYSITNHSINFTHLTIDQWGNIYVGAANWLFQLNGSLDVIESVRTGPIYDSPLCSPTDCGGVDETTIALRNNLNKVLVVDETSNSLLVCGTVHQGILVVNCFLINYLIKLCFSSIRSLP